MQINIKQLSKEEYWLFEQAKSLIKKARRKAFDGTVVYSPTTDDFYVYTTYLRDFAYMLSCPDGIPFEDALGNLQFFFKYQREDGSLPAFINYKEKEIRYKSHGADIPDLDTVSSAIVAVWYLWKQNKNIFNIFREPLRAALTTVVTDFETGLVYVDPKAIHTSYGFTDTIGKAGRELFCSLLLREAYIKLVEMEKFNGDSNQSEKYESEAKRIKSNLGKLWDEREGYFFAADMVCRQPDVWGNAYAVYSEAVSEEIAKRISKWFCKNYALIVFNGMIRHLPEQMHWEYKISDSNFQDGTYWTHPSGWVAYTISLTDPELGRSLLKDTIKEIQTNGVWECYNKETQQYRAKENLSSILVPMEVILRNKKCFRGLNVIQR